MLETNGDFSRFSSKQCLRLIKKCKTDSEKKFLATICVYIAKKIKEHPWLTQRFINECLHRSRYRLSSLEQIRFKRPDVSDLLLIKTVAPKTKTILPLFKKQTDFTIEEIYFRNCYSVLDDDNKLTERLTHSFNEIFCFPELKDDVTDRIKIAKEIAEKEKKGVLKVDQRAIEKERIAKKLNVRFTLAHENKLLEIAKEFNSTPDDKINDFKTKHKGYEKFINQLIFNKNFEVFEFGKLLLTYYNGTYEVAIRQFYKPETYTKGVFQKPFSNLKIGRNFVHSSKEINDFFKIEVFSDEWHLDMGIIVDGLSPTAEVIQEVSPTLEEFKEYNNKFKKGGKFNNSAAFTAKKEDLDLGNAKVEIMTARKRAHSKEFVTMFENNVEFLPFDLIKQMEPVIKDLVEEKYYVQDAQFYDKFTRSYYLYYQICLRARTTHIEVFKNNIEDIKYALRKDIIKMDQDIIFNNKYLENYINAINQRKWIPIFHNNTELLSFAEYLYNEFLAYELNHVSWGVEVEDAIESETDENIEHTDLDLPDDNQDEPTTDDKNSSVTDSLVKKN